MPRRTRTTATTPPARTSPCASRPARRAAWSATPPVSSPPLHGHQARTPHMGICRPAALPAAELQNPHRQRPAARRAGRGGHALVPSALLPLCAATALCPALTSAGPRSRFPCPPGGKGQLLVSVGGRGGRGRGQRVVVASGAAWVLGARCGSSQVLGLGARGPPHAAAAAAAACAASHVHPSAPLIPAPPWSAPLPQPRRAGSIGTPKATCTAPTAPCRSSSGARLPPLLLLPRLLLLPPLPAAAAAAAAAIAARGCRVQAPTALVVALQDPDPV